MIHLRTIWNKNISNNNSFYLLFNTQSFQNKNNSTIPYSKDLLQHIHVQWDVYNVYITAKTECLKIKQIYTRGYIYWNMFKNEHNIISNSTVIVVIILGQYAHVLFFFSILWPFLWYTCSLKGKIIHFNIPLR